jgi:transposase
MAAIPHPPSRFIGLDIHKNFCVAIGVNRELEQVFGSHKVFWPDFEDWIKRHLTPDDSVVIEMTTNTWEVYDALVDKVHAVTVVHPPHIKIITRAQVMNDKIAARVLARLHASGLLPGIWVPPQEVRELRALVAQRQKMSHLAVMAQTRLQNVVHRHHLKAPKGHAFAAKNRDFWENMPISAAEKAVALSDLATLDFAKQQKENLEQQLAVLAAQDERVPLLVQLPGVGLLLAMTILATIGDITRFPSAKHLVGYAGLHGRVHQSGEKHTTGKLVNHGRKDLRWAMVEAALVAIRCHPHWKAQYRQIEARRGKHRARVAVARKLLVVVWHVLTKRELDRFAVPEKVASTFFAHAYRVGIKNLPDGMSAREYTRHCLDLLGAGQNLKYFPYGKKRYTLPPSKLPDKK